MWYFLDMLKHSNKSHDRYQKMFIVLNLTVYQLYRTCEKRKIFQNFRPKRSVRRQSFAKIDIYKKKNASLR